MAVIPRPWMESRPDIQSVAVADPAANNVSWSIPANECAQIIGIRFTYTTDAAAGSRVITVHINDTVPRTLQRTLSPIVQTGGTAWGYELLTSVPSIDHSATQNRVQMAIPPTFFMLPGYSLIVGGLGILGADRVTGLNIRYLRWYEN